MLFNFRHNRFSRSWLPVAFFTVAGLFCFTGISMGQHTDTTLKKTSTFSGSLGLSTNGFSIVPTFSLNSPSVMVLLAWKKNRFSIEPDIRLTPDAKKGSMLLWFRYKVVEKEKYSLRLGAHPAMNFQTRSFTENGNKVVVSQMRRFLAWELSNDLKLSKHLRAGLYYLQANGMQKDGPRTTHFVSLNTVVSNINLGRQISLTLAPSVYYLYLDGNEGKYVSGSVIVSHVRLPFTLQHAFNKTFSSNIPGNRDYMWNLSAHYHFKKTYRRV
jgi:hypothetical protein